jgi:hypothetical protein
LSDFGDAQVPCRFLVFGELLLLHGVLQSQWVYFLLRERLVYGQNLLFSAA